MSREWEHFTNQQQWKDFIQTLLGKNNKALIRAIKLIYHLQTDQEKYYGSTGDHNGVGFSRVDSEFMTDLVIKMKHQGTLTERELAIARNKMKKYWKQLMKISKKEIIMEEI